MITRNNYNIINIYYILIINIYLLSFYKNIIFYNLFHCFFISFVKLTYIKIELFQRKDQFIVNRLATCFLTTKRARVSTSPSDILVSATSHKDKPSLNGTWICVIANCDCNLRRLFVTGARPTPLLAHVSVESRPDFLLIVRSRRPPRHLLLVHIDICLAHYYIAMHFTPDAPALFVKLGSPPWARRVHKCALACFVCSSESVTTGKEKIIKEHFAAR